MINSQSTFLADADSFTSVVGALTLVTKQKSLTLPDSRQVPADEIAYNIGGNVIEPPLPLDQLLVLFHTSSVHSACIIAKATDATGLGWRLAPLSSARSPNRLSRERDKLDVKLQVATPDITFSEMLQQAAREREIFGWSFWEVVRHPTQTEGLGEIGAIYPIPGHTIRVTKDRDLYVQIKGNKQRWFKRFGSRKQYNADTGETIAGATTSSENLASELIKFGGYSPESSLYPIPDWISAIPSMAELAAIREYNISWFNSGGTADRIIVVTGNSPAVAERISNEIEAKLREARGKGHVTLSVWGSADMKVAVANMSAGTGRGEGNRERQFRGGREDLVREVLMAHRVPPYRVAWAEMGPVHKETDVLTEAGWKPITEIVVGEKVASLNLKTRQMEFQPVKQTHKYHYEELLVFHNKWKVVEIAVSPDHRMIAGRTNLSKQVSVGSRKRLWSVRENGKWYKASEMEAEFKRVSHAKFRIPTACVLDGEDPITPDEAALMGWLVSEGSLRYRPSNGYEVSIFQKRGTAKSKDIADLLRRLDINFSVGTMTSKAGHLFPQGTVQTKDCVLDIYRLLVPGKYRAWDLMGGVKKVPMRLLYASVEAKKAFLAAAIAGDGWSNKRTGAHTYFSSDKDIADWIQIIALSVGQTCFITRDRNRSWACRMPVGRPFVDSRIVNYCSRMPYDDYAYCLTVQNGTLVYRYKGHPYVAGNSLGGSAAREMLRTYRFGGVEPIQVVLEDRLAGTLFGPDGYNLKTSRFVLEDLDWDTMELDIDKAERGVHTGIMTPNEARVLLGMDPSSDKNLDKFYMLTTIQSVAQTLKPPAPPKIVAAGPGGQPNGKELPGGGPNGKQPANNRLVGRTVQQ